MDPSATPPWRVLETPSSETADPRTVAAGVGKTAWAKVAGILGAAAICAVVAVVLASSGSAGTIQVDGGMPLREDASSSEPAASNGPPGGELVVEVVGAVPKPGVYRLPRGSRVVDLVQQAGGYGPRVDTARAEQELNLAAPLDDGDHIRVPSRDDPVAIGSAGPDDAPTGDLVDINTATQAQLEELPGIGPATAQKIIAAREEARFSAIEELRSRGVLGEKTFEKLRDLVTVG
jgi:competence protein ComEA